MHSRRPTARFSRCDIGSRRINAGSAEFVDVIGQTQISGETVIVRRFLMPLTFCAMTALYAEAQGVFPAPLPNQSGEAPATAPPLGSPGAIFPSPPVHHPGIAQTQEECRTIYPPLRQDAEKKAEAIKLASDRKAPPHEACGLLKSYVQAKAKLVDFVATRRVACGVPTNIVKQLEDNQARSQLLMKAVCAADNRLPGDQSPSRLPPGQPDAARGRNWGDEIFIPRLMERQGHGR